MNIPVFWDITPCRPLKINWRFGGTCRLYKQGQRISEARNWHKAGNKQSSVNVQGATWLYSPEVIIRHSTDVKYFPPISVINLMTFVSIYVTGTVFPMNTPAIIQPSNKLYRFKDSSFRFRNVNKTATNTMYTQLERKHPPESRTVEIPPTLHHISPFPDTHTHTQLDPHMKWNSTYEADQHSYVRCNSECSILAFPL
jgi:hypothetical protein